MLSAIPEESVCSFLDLACGRQGDALALNVKRTFIELVASPKKLQRKRSLTDSELLLAGEDAGLVELSDASTSVPSDEECNLEVQHPADWESPYWGPAEDHFYASVMADNFSFPSLSDEVTEHSLAAALATHGYPSSMAPYEMPWVPQCYTETPSFATGDATNCFAASDFEETLGGGTASNTTIMLRNIPAGFTRSSLIEVLEDEGFEGSYDLVYVPMDFSGKRCLGYGFVDFVTASDAHRCWAAFAGYVDWGEACDVPCEVVWSDPHQGVVALIERYRNSPVMHESVPDEWKPAYFVDGVQVPFPAPTAFIKAPKQKNSRGKSKKDAQ